MITSRRLAREWALKILYQVDVGNVPLEEALISALERLRREFVIRGSHLAGSKSPEAAALQEITLSLADVIPILTPEFERALAQATKISFQEILPLQELRFERSFRHQAPGVPLEPLRIFPEPDESLYRNVRSGLKNPVHLKRYDQFVDLLKQKLPELADKEVRKTGLTAAKQIAASRPLNVSPNERQQWLLTERREFRDVSERRWNHVGAEVYKQTGDWLKTAAFAYRLASGTFEIRKEIDRQLTLLSSGWSLDRQVAVDRSILRLAGYEILALADVPAAVTINEAVELAKRYSTAESSRFVNGVLGSLAQIAIEQGVRKETSALLRQGQENDEAAPVPAEPDDSLLEEIDITELEDSGENE